MSDFLSISEIADKCGVEPRRVSDLLYRRKVDPSQCVVKAGRRLIPVALLPQIQLQLKRKRSSAK